MRFKPFFVILFLLSTFAFAQQTSHSRVGFYTGTFDPPHRGHWELLQRAIQELQLDVLYVMPNVDPSHKPGATQNSHRIEMAKLAFQDIPQVVVADPEHLRIIESAGGVGAYQRFLSQKHSDGLVYHIMGDDSYERLAANRDITLPSNFVVAVSPRSKEIEILDVSLKDTPVVKLSADDAGYSSTLFRNLIRLKRIPKEIAPRVLEYIFRHNLYRDITPMCKYLF